MTDVILTLDIGTSSTRAVLYTASDATLIPGAMQAMAHEPDATPDGRSTLDPQQLFEEAITCATTVLARSESVRVIGVAICTFWHSAIGVDKSGNPVTPVLLWSDTRSRPQVARLKAEQEADAYTARTGCPLHTSYLPGRLLHLRETEPERFAACHWFLSPGEFLIAQLFGLERVTCSASMASASGLFDQHRQMWDEETLSWLGLTPAHFPPLGENPVIGTKAAFAGGPFDGVPVFPALGDGACSNVGCGATTPERMALMVGTSGAMRVIVPGLERSRNRLTSPFENEPPSVPNGLWRYQLAPSRFLLGGALTNGGAVWAWLKETVQVSALSAEQLTATLNALPPDGHGLTVLPFFSGERAPLWRDDLRAVIHGLSAATTPIEIVRAHLEAVALRFAALRDALRPVAPNAEILGTGAGLLASPAWAQIIADALGEPIHLSAEREASSRGAALMARERLGYGRLGDAPTTPVTRTLLPDPTNTQIYAQARARQEALLQRLLDF